MSGLRFSAEWLEEGVRASPELQATDCFLEIHVGKRRVSRFVDNCWRRNQCVAFRVGCRVVPDCCDRVVSALLFQGPVVADLRRLFDLWRMAAVLAATSISPGGASITACPRFAGSSTFRPGGDREAGQPFRRFPTAFRGNMPVHFGPPACRARSEAAFAACGVGRPG